jgi:hypothetical protein
LTDARLDSVISLGAKTKCPAVDKPTVLARLDTYSADLGEQIMVEIKSLLVNLPNGDTVELFCSVYQGNSQSYLTEEFRIEMDHGVPVALPAGSRMRTVFRGLRELDSSCFLILRLVRNRSRNGQKQDAKRNSMLHTPPRFDRSVSGNTISQPANLPPTPLLETHDWIKVEPADDRIRTPLGYAALAIDRLRAGAGGMTEFSLDVFAPKDGASWASVPTELLSNRWSTLTAVDESVDTGQIKSVT